MERLEDNVTSVERVDDLEGHSVRRVNGPTVATSAANRHPHLRVSQNHELGTRNRFQQAWESFTFLFDSRHEQRCLA
jgi:hypothetical protein